MHHQKAQPVTTKYDIAQGYWARRVGRQWHAAALAWLLPTDRALHRAEAAVLSAGHATGLQPAITSIDRSLITHAILPAAPALYGKGRSFSFTYPTNQLD